MTNIAPQIRQLTQRLAQCASEKEYLRAQQNEDVVSVDRIASQMSHLYERMRYSVDYKEEHLLRRNAIERMLKRRLLESFRRGNVAAFLVTEIVRAGYLPNNTVPERIVVQIDHIITKALCLYRALEGDTDEILGTSARFNDIVALTATEIESYLFPNTAAHAVADAFYLSVRDRIVVKDVDLPDEEKYTQTYITCYRSLLGYDEKTMFYVLWLLYHPAYQDDATEEVLADVAQHFDTYTQTICAQLAHPLNWRLMPKIRDEAIYFSLIRESAIEKQSLWGIQTLDIVGIKKHVTSLLRRKYAQEKKHIIRSVNRVIIYILLTKTILAFLIELPYDIFVAGEVNKVVLGINIVFHPLLLFIVTRVVRLPREESHKQTITSVVDIIEGKKLPQINVWMQRKKSLFGSILVLIYLFFFVLIFSGIIWVLMILHFNIVSSGLFLLFLTLVSYFGLRIRARAKRWRVTPQETSVKGFIVDILTLPIVQSGQWITQKFDSVNIFVFVMDFLIETPFKMFIQIVEGFTNYLREKKEELE